MTDWKITVSIKKEKLDQHINRLKEYLAEGKAICIESASNEEEAIRMGHERFVKTIGLPWDSLGKIKARRMG